MSDNLEKEHIFLGIPQLSLRSLILGAFGSCLITASSMYVALRMSALPWPTIFVAVLSLALLKALGKTTLNEVNITQTSMSAGAMVAGGIAFTIPGLWITGQWKDFSMTGSNFWKVMGIAFAGMLLGTVLTWILRQRFIITQALPYPIGTAAAETITTGDAGGGKARLLFGTMGFSALFTYLRDGIGWIPSAITSNWLYSKNFFIGIWTSPMAVGIGYMIGTLYTGVWFLGALISYLLIIPFGPALGFFQSVEAASAFKNTSGIGLMVGTGAGILISYIYTLVKKINVRNSEKAGSEAGNSLSKSKSGRIFIMASVLFSYLISIACGLGPVTSVLLIGGVFAASAMAATITGETGINPMEIFGIIILIIIRLFIRVDVVNAFFIAGCVAVACGYAGDLLNDYKTGHMLGTNPTAQMISQIVGGIVGAVIATAAMFAILHQFGGVGPDKGLPAGQAFAVSQMVNGIGSPMVFGIAAALGAILYLIKVPAMTLGIGMYLPFEISSIVFLGGILRFIIERTRKKPVEVGNIAASGLLGGEGVTGVTIAIVKMITGG